MSSSDETPTTMADLPNARDFIDNHIRIAVPADDEPECPICYNEWNSPAEEVVATPVCGHHFHKSCLVEWIINSRVSGRRTCPVCRRVLCQNSPRLENALMRRVRDPIPDWFRAPFSALQDYNRLDVNHEQVYSILNEESNPRRHADAMQAWIQSALPWFRQQVIESGGQLSEAAMIYVITSQFFRHWSMSGSIEGWAALCAGRISLYAEAAVVPEGGDQRELDIILHHGCHPSYLLSLDRLAGLPYNRKMVLSIEYPDEQGGRSAIRTSGRWRKFFGSDSDFEISYRPPGFLSIAEDVREGPGWLSSITVDCESGHLQVVWADGQTIDFRWSLEETEHWDTANYFIDESDYESDGLSS